MKMQFRTVLLICLIIISLCACGSESKTAEPTQFPQLITPAPSSPDNKSTAAATNPPSKNLLEDEDSLTVLLYGNSAKPDTHPLYLLAQEFMRINPNKTISCEFLSAVRNYTTNALLGAIYVANNGMGADIIEFKTLSDIPLLKRSLTFVDLKVLMDNDNGFNRDEYFEGILDAVTIDGKIEILPLDATFAYFVTDKANEWLYDDSPTISFAKILDIYDYVAAERGNIDDLYLLDYPVDTYGMFWAFDIDAIKPGDKVSFRGNFAGKDLLERWFKIPDINPVFFNSSGEEGIHPGDVESVFKRYPEGISTKSLFLDYPDFGFAQPVSLAGSSGDISYVPGKTVAINEKSPNKELAWEFIKFCAENRPIDRVGSNRPVYAFLNSINRQAFKEANEQDFSDLYKNNAEQGYVSSKDENKAVMDATARLTAMMEQCGLLNRVSGDLKAMFDMYGSVDYSGNNNNQFKIYKGHYYKSSVGFHKILYTLVGYLHPDIIDRLLGEFEENIKTHKLLSPISSF